MRRTLGLIVVAVLGLTLAGCGGAPSAEGEWRIVVPLQKTFPADDGPQEEVLELEADIQQLEEGGLEGTATTSEAIQDTSCSYQVISPARAAQTGLDASRVSEEGEITLALQGDCGSNVYFALEGEIDGDTITGEAMRPMDPEEEDIDEGIGARAISGPSAYEPLYVTGPGEWEAERI